MKKGLLLILVVVCAVCVSAQKYPYTVETNRFWNNWFVSVGGGVQVNFGDFDSELGFGKRLAPALDIAVGKWFTPVIGLRLAYNGLQAKGAGIESDNYLTGDVVGDGYYKQKWNLANFHGDVLINLSNLFCGYNEKRVYSFIPYLGAGWVHAWSDPTDDNIGFNLGLINRFRLSDAWDFNLEVRDVMMKNTLAGSDKESLLGVTIGFTYKFKKRNWNGLSTVPMVPQSELDALKEKMNQLKGENEALKNDLIECRNRKPAPAPPVQQVECPQVERLVVVFTIGKADISKKEYMNIEAMANCIKESNGKVYTVTGYADKGTGSAEQNLKLSKKRAEAVRDLMVKEFGVSDSQLKVDYKGGVDNIFYDDAALSRVAIVEE